MLESASRSNEGHTSLAGKTDRAHGAFHAAIRAARSAPDRIAACQASFASSVVQCIGIQPKGFGIHFESFCGMLNRTLSRYVIFVPRIIIGNDSDSNCALHINHYERMLKKEKFQCQKQQDSMEVEMYSACRRTVRDM